MSARSTKMHSALLNLTWSINGKRSGAGNRNFTLISNNIYIMRNLLYLKRHKFWIIKKILKHEVNGKYFLNKEQIHSLNHSDTRSCDGYLDLQSVGHIHSGTTQRVIVRSLCHRNSGNFFIPALICTHKSPCGWFHMQLKKVGWQS